MLGTEAPRIGYHLVGADGDHDSKRVHEVERGKELVILLSASLLLLLHQTLELLFVITRLSQRLFKLVIAIWHEFLMGIGLYHRLDELLFFGLELELRLKVFDYALLGLG